jgi:deazaflavin-dependent oxidoreductase (nitroreductase family)
MAPILASAVAGRVPVRHSMLVSYASNEYETRWPYHWSVPLPGWLAQFNRPVTNPVLRPMAKRLPYFGVVLHRGRTSGRLYRTPVTTFPHGDGFVIALTYGRDVDWVKNVITAGRCRLIQRRRAVDLVGPRVTPLREDGGAIPGWIRIILRMLRVREVLHLDHGRVG